MGETIGDWPFAHPDQRITEHRADKAAPTRGPTCIGRVARAFGDWLEQYACRGRRRLVAYRQCAPVAAG